MDADQGTGQDTATEVADEVARRIMATDRAAARLGITLGASGPGTATLAMTVREDMTQGHGTCQGGVTFTLADTAFAVACNSHGDKVVAQHCSISYLAPAQVGDRLVAVAIERSRTGRSGLYDITVTRQDGTVIAEFRGHSRTVGGRWLDAP
jgi:acyl-CoA thioesterase